MLLLHKLRLSAKAVTCDECGAEARLYTNDKVYGERRGKWPFIWFCDACGAFVGCHPGTSRPLGTLADAPTRTARRLAHEVFDPMWKGGSAVFKDRSEAYRWLAHATGFHAGKCHIAKMSAVECTLVIKLCKEYNGESKE